jgi:hypothetical protein
VLARGKAYIIVRSVSCALATKYARDENPVEAPNEEPAEAVQRVLDHPALVSFNAEE